LKNHYLSRLNKLDVCAVSDAKDALGLGPAITSLSKVSGSGQLAGIVKTVQLVAGSAPENAPKVHLGATAIMESNSQSVIVISHPGVNAGGWGGVLSAGAKVRGVRGVILDGPTRDADEAKELDFTIFSKGTTALTARGRLHESATGVDVEIEDQVVSDGDYVLADSSGIVFICASDIDAVLKMAERIAAKESMMIDALHAGKPITEVMGADYETMLENNK